MEQGSQEWIQARLGKFTGSGISDLLVQPKKGEAISQTRHTYLLKKIGEIDTGMPSEEVFGKALDWGKEHEPLARKWYERYSGLPVEPCDFVPYCGVEYFGASPDGKVRDNHKIGAVEIKCPYVTSNHLEHCLIDSRDYFKKYFKDYYWQTVSEMMVLGADFTDFVSFDPRMKSDAGIKIIRMDLDREDAKTLLNCVIEARVQMKSIAKELNIEI